MEGLRTIIDDLVTTSTAGIEARNADGEVMVIFTEVVGYVADYHETGYGLDVTGQNGKAPCHLCAFLRYNGHPSTSSKYAHSTLIHSCGTCYARMGERTEAIRATNIPDDELVSIGLNRQQQAKEKNSPLRELSLKMKEAAKRTIIPLTTEDIPVVNPKFDQYRSVLVSPDHVLFGVAVNSLNFAFFTLPSNARRQQVDAIICSVLRQNGLTKESQIYNFNSSAVHASSISVRFCTLLVSPEIFKEVFEDCKRCKEISLHRNSPVESSLENLVKLRDLVAATYWYPDMRVDGMELYKSFNENGGLAHLAKLERMCEEYVHHVNFICKAFPHGRAEMDKPNVHRTLELYKHSIPAMGHVRHFAELVFETAHQPLKRAMLRSNFRNSHVQSSWTCLADDWKRRLQYIINESPTDANEETRKKRELATLLCGRNEEVIEQVMNDVEVMKEASNTLRSKPLRNFLSSNPSKLNNKDITHRWILSDPISCDRGSPSEADTNLMELVSKIQTLANDILVEEGTRHVIPFRRAGRVKFTASGSRLCSSQAKGHDMLYRGTVLQIWVEDDHAVCLAPVEREHQETTILGYFAIELLINFGAVQIVDQLSDYRNYAVVRECKPTDGKLLEIKWPATLQLLSLTEGVRRVGLSHACYKDSSLQCFSECGLNHQCDASILDGHQFYYYRRDQGYPPRMA